MKRTTALFLVLAMVFFACAFLTARGNNRATQTDNHDGKDNKDTSSSEQQITEPTADPFAVDRFVIPEEGYDGSQVTLTFYHNLGLSRVFFLSESISRFNKLYPNIKVNLKDIEDLQDTIGSGLESGTAPNIAVSTSGQLAYYRHLVDYPVVTLDDLMLSTIPVSRADGTRELLGLSEEQCDDLYTGFLDTTKVYGDGLTYAMPLSRTTNVLYYNKTFFDENNLSVPTTWDEMEDVCRRIKELDPDCIPLSCDSEADLFINYAMQSGGGYIADDGSLNFNSETNREFMQRLRGWYQDNLIATMGTAGISPFFTSTTREYCYMAFSTSSNSLYCSTYDGSFEMGVAMLPQLNETPWILTQGTDLCIFQQENPQEVIASWLLVKFICTDAQFQAEYALEVSCLPVIKSAMENKKYMRYLGEADGYENIQALTDTVCLSAADWYGAPNANRYGKQLTTAVTNLVNRCMMASMDDVAQSTMDLFNRAESEATYNRK